jgi:HEAT repeat protein
MAEGFFDRNVKRLLGVGRASAEPTPHFRERLRLRLQQEAGQMRADAVPDPASPATIARRPGWGAAAAAILVLLAGAWGVWRYGFGTEQSPGLVKPGLDVNPRTPRPLLAVSADERVVISVRKGAEGSVSLEKKDAEIARLDLRDGASVEVRPAEVPALALGEGLLRVEAHRPLWVHASIVALEVQAGADVEIEHVKRSGDGEMNKSWLIPGGVVVAVGATVVAILVHKGDVEVRSQDSRPAPVAIEKPIVIEVPATRPAVDEDGARKLAQAERKIAELEKKLAAAKKEGDKLAADLVQKKGVTIENITARIADLRKKPNQAILPGATTDLIADLKGLGAAGLQAVLDLLKSEDPKDRALAAKLLEDMKDPAAIPALREVALNDTDPTAISRAVHALALIGDGAATETLREVLARKRSDADVINSLWGLVNLADPQGMEQAIAYMNDKSVDENNRAMLAANVAYLMGDRADVMPMVDAMTRDFYMSRQVMGIAVDYYRQLGTPEARSRLQAISTDMRVAEAIRNKAIQALQH